MHSVSEVIAFITHGETFFSFEVDSSYHRNVFIENCLQAVLKFSLHHLGQEEFLRRLTALYEKSLVRELAYDLHIVILILQISITLRADNDFYSQIEEVSLLI